MNIPSLQAPATLLGDVAEAPGSWPWLGAALPVEAIWEVSPWKEYLFLCLSVSSQVCLLKK